MKNKLVRNALIYGLIAGVGLTVIYGITVFSLQSRDSLIIGSILTFAVFIFLALYTYKRFYGRGFLHLWQALATTYLLIITASIIGFIFFVIFLSLKPAYIDQEYQRGLRTLERTKEQVIQEYGQEKFDELYEKSSQKPSPVDIAVTLLVWQLLLFGPGPGLILSMVMRRTEFQIREKTDNKNGDKK